MFDKIEYKTTWCDSGDEMPMADTNCPKCEKANIKISQYNEKEKYCPVCKWKWKISKFPKKIGGNLKEVKEFVSGEDRMINEVFTMDSIRLILEDLQKKVGDIYKYVQSRTK